MDINLLKLVFILKTVFIVFFGTLINSAERYLPTIIVQSFRYGKFAYTGTPSPNAIEVPKSWFRHFYLFSSVITCCAAWLVLGSYKDGEIPEFIFPVLDLVRGRHRVATASSLSVTIVFILLLAQCVRRFQETWFISVFSHSKMNLSHYVVGYSHYLGVVLVILSEAPGFCRPLYSPRLEAEPLSNYTIIGAMIFVFAWYQQGIVNKTLANLRKDSTGRVVTLAHKIPTGGLFEYVSSPHLFCEILMYLSLYLILLENTTMVYVFIWVLTNQIETGLLTHWWYLDNFKEYPKNRKAVIPFIL